MTRNRGKSEDLGNVMAAYYRPGLPYWLSVYIESDRAKTALPRADGVIIIACRRTYRQSHEPERFHCLNPAMSSAQLAQVLLLLVGLKKPGDLSDPAMLLPGDDLQPLFRETPASGLVIPGEDVGPVPIVRVHLLGAYRQCLLLEGGPTGVEIICIDGHPLVALAYWGKRIVQPLRRVHPDDRPLCVLAGSERDPARGRERQESCPGNPPERNDVPGEVRRGRFWSMGLTWRSDRKGEKL